MHYHEEAPVLKFYKRLRNSRNVADVDLPTSSIWYVRAAIEARYGEYYTVEHVQISCWLEGLIDPNSVTRIPRWYVERYMHGLEPNFRELKNQVTELYAARQQALVSAEQEPPDNSLANFLID